MICTEDTHLMTITKDGFDAIMGAYKKKILQDKIDFL